MAAGWSTGDDVIINDNDNDNDRAEWREKWFSMQKVLGKFKPSEDMKTLKEETFGLKEGKDQPLYAYGNQISFFRLPVYPESKPKGTKEQTSE